MISLPPAAPMISTDGASLASAANGHLADVGVEASRGGRGAVVAPDRRAPQAVVVQHLQVAQVDGIDTEHRAPVAGRHGVGVLQRLGGIGAHLQLAARRRQHRPPAPPRRPSAIQARPSASTMPRPSRASSTSETEDHRRRPDGGLQRHGDQAAERPHRRGPRSTAGASARPG